MTERWRLAHVLTDDEAAVVRGRALELRDGRDETPTALYSPSGDRWRVWLPIEFVQQATGRARCRSCSETIPKGERCIRFQFDPYGASGWGKLAAAYLHVECPGQEKSDES